MDQRTAQTQMHGTSSTRGTEDGSTHGTSSIRGATRWVRSLTAVSPGCQETTAKNVEKKQNETETKPLQTVCTIMCGSSR